MANPEQYGLFVPTTNVWDVNEIYETDVSSPEFKELLVRLYQNINVISLALNLKDSGYYVQSEFVNGQVFFPNPANNSATQLSPSDRQVYRIVVDFGTLPNATTKSVAHKIPITSMTTFTRIYCAASDTTGETYIPIPYIDPSGNNVSLTVTNTNVVIVTSSDRTNYTICYVVLEYIQS